MAENEYFDPSFAEALEEWKLAEVAERVKQQEYSNSETVKVKILVWGPGTGFEKFYKKRRTIAEHLNKCHECNHAVFSEDILRYNAVTQQSEVIPEEITHAFLDDLIIVLEADPVWKAMGPYSEKVLAATRTDFAKKMVDLIPARFRPDTGKGGGFPQLITNLVKSENIMYYTPQQLNVCHDIRAFCEKKAAEVRLHLYYKYQFSRQGMEAP